MTLQKVEQCRAAALQSFEAKPSIFTICYDQLKLMTAPVPYFNQRKSTCICNTIASEIVCHTCQIGYHKTCMKQAAAMKQFICPSCQLNLMDPTCLPLMYLVEPFVV